MTYYLTVLVVLVALFVGGGILVLLLGYRMMKTVDRARFGRRNQYGAETFGDYDTAHRVQMAENTRRVIGRLMFLAGIGLVLLGPFISLLVISTM
jgi:uncharacterized membrane protein